MIAYQREYYEERIRTTYDVLLTQVQDEWQTAVASGNTTEHKEPTPMAIRTKTAKTVWEQETQEFKDEFQARVDAEYKQAMETFLNRHQTPSTAEEYHRYARTFLSYHCIQPDAHTRRAYQSMPAVINAFIEGVSQCLGVAITVVMVGPVPSQGGRVSVNRFVLSTSPTIHPVSLFGL